MSCKSLFYGLFVGPGTYFSQFYYSVAVVRPSTIFTGSFSALLLPVGRTVVDGIFEGVFY